MAIVSIPSLMRDLTQGKAEVVIQGSTLRELVENIEAQFPGVKDRLCHEDANGVRISPYIGVYVDGALVEKVNFRLGPAKSGYPSRLTLERVLIPSSW